MPIVKRKLEDYQTSPEIDDEDIADSVNGIWRFIWAAIGALVFVLTAAYFLGWLLVKYF